MKEGFLTFGNILTYDDGSRCGTWTLTDDGTLRIHPDESGSFDGGDYLAVGDKVRRIEFVEGSYYVLNRISNVGDWRNLFHGAFECLPNCTEVVFDDGVWFDDTTFAHCHALAHLICRKGDEAIDLLVADAASVYGNYREDAFTDTPFRSFASKGGSAPKVAAGDGVTLSSGVWGNWFLNKLAEELVLMNSLKTPEYTSAELYFRPPEDGRPWFGEALKALGHGVDEGEPTMLFLAAEHAHYGGASADGDEASPAAGEEPSPGEDVANLYVTAAERGSLHAQLWCAFCLDQGAYGFRQDHVRSGDYLARAKARLEADDEHSTLSLSFPELDFMASYHNLLVNWHGDEIDDEFWAGDPIESMKGRLPNPSFHATHRRADRLSRFAMSLGLPLASGFYPTAEGDCDWERFDANKAYLRKTKQEWLAWCQLHDVDADLGRQQHGDDRPGAGLLQEFNLFADVQAQQLA